MSRIDSGTILVAFFAILFGLVGAFLLRKTLQSKRPVAQAPPEVERGPAKITVPLASRDLRAGTQITLDDVALFSLTRDEMKKHGIKRVFMSNPDQIIGKTVSVDLRRGATFDTKDFYPPGTGPGIADKLQPGQRAVTIDVTATSALLGFAGAGQNVDVLFHYGQRVGNGDRYTGDRDLNDRYQNTDDYWEPEHFQYNSPRGLDNYAGSGRYHRNYDGSQTRSRGVSAAKYHNATVTLVQKATILALGQRVNQTGNSSQLGSEERVRVTLAVKPESAELIRVAEGHGELSLTLRGAGDEEIVEINEPATLSNIIVVEEEEPVQFARREVRDMDIYRGQNRSRVRFLRDRDTGKDDFQKWILINEDSQGEREPRQEDDVNVDLKPRQLSDHEVEPSLRPNLGPNFERNFGPNTEPNPGYRNLETADGFLMNPREESQLQRLRSDFRRIKTLFNQEPQLRDQPDQRPRVDINAPQPSQSGDVSSKAAEKEVRSAAAIEIYDPRWE